MWIEVVLIVLTLLFLWQNLKKPSEYPPGPWGLPLIGYIPFFSKKNSGQLLSDLNQKHGNVTSWRMGTQLIVFIFDYKLMKEAFNGSNMMDRPDMKLLSLLIQEPRLGVIGTSGVHWHNARRFALRHLRDLGMGKSSFVSAVQQEALELVKELKTHEGSPTVIPSSLTVSILNVVWQLVASKRYDLHDKEIHKFRDLMTSVVQNGSRIIFTDFLPWIKYVVPDFIMVKFTRENFLRNISDNLSKYIEKFVTEHQKKLDPNEPKDLIDEYLVEMNKRKDDPDSFMSLRDLNFLIADLFFAGTETTTTTLEWAMLYLIKYPEVQKKLQKEIDEVLPKGTLATLEDRKRLPYTEAFTHELLRASSLAALGGMHMATRDSVIGGYLIPKGALVAAASGVAHHNQKNFDSPDSFRPERFLDSEGKFVNPKDGFLPFGIGRRVCLGESLARMELLIFLTTLVQNLNFSCPPQTTPDLAWNDGNPFIRTPNKTQKIMISSR